MHRAIYSSNADILPIIPSGMYFDKMLVEVHKFVFTKKMHSKCHLQNVGHFALVSKS